MSPIIISVVNHKGGVYKTTVTTNLGAGLARAGKKVLVIDFDAQQDLTASLIGHKPDSFPGAQLCDLLLDEQSLDTIIEHTRTPGLDIIPTTEEFFLVELNLVNAMGREYFLRSCLSKTQRLADYDLVLIDNSPSIGLVTTNALAVSNYFLVPVKAEYLPMKGLVLLGSCIGRLQKITPDLAPLGVVVTNYSATEAICKQVDATLRKELGDKVFKSIIRVNTKAKSAPSVQKTIFEYENNPRGRSTQDYDALADEVLVRLGMTRAVPRIPLESRSKLLIVPREVVNA